MKIDLFNRVPVSIITVAILLNIVPACAEKTPVHGETLPPKAEEKSSDPSKTLKEEFLKLKFGMFIHYNMATYTGEKWASGYPDPSTFNPGVETIDTDAWADAAVAAGMTYGVLTVKHVGGFCLWDSEHTTYDVMHPDCPYKKDLVAQFIKSFKSRGLKAGLYYCWREPGFDGRRREKGKFKVLPPECDPLKHSLEEQKKFHMAQIKELLTKYPDVFYIWNDAFTPAIATAEELKELIKSTNPKVLASSNWWDGQDKGKLYLDIAVTEKNHFPEDNKLPGETCWCLERGHWFWKGKARIPSTPAEYVTHIQTANSRNANFLLNVGPDSKGNISPLSINALKEIGKLRREAMEKTDK